MLDTTVHAEGQAEAQAVDLVEDAVELISPIPDHVNDGTEYLLAEKGNWVKIVLKRLGRC